MRSVGSMKLPRLMNSALIALAGLPGEVDAQGRADAVFVQGDADQALLWPEA